MKCPSDIYEKSGREYKGLPNVEYPMHDFVTTVTRCGHICMKKHKISLSKVFAGQEVALKEVDEKMWLVSFMKYDIGYFDNEQTRRAAIRKTLNQELI